MKRIMLALLAGAVLSAGSTWALASHDEPIPAECGSTHAGTDIADSTSAEYLTGGVLNVNLSLSGPSCLAADYSVVVYDKNPSGGTPVILDAVSFPGDGTSSQFTISRRVLDDDSDGVCVNLLVSTTERQVTDYSWSSDSSSSTAPSGNGGAPSMQDSDKDTDTDTNSVDTETVVDWGAEDEGSAEPCVSLAVSPRPGLGSRGFN